MIDSCKQDEYPQKLLKRKQILKFKWNSRSLVGAFLSKKSKLTKLVEIEQHDIFRNNWSYLKAKHINKTVQLKQNMMQDHFSLLAAS